MKKLLILLSAVLLFACDSKAPEEIDAYDIAKRVKNNTVWPVMVEGVFEEKNQDGISGVDVNIVGNISSSTHSFITVHVLKSVLARNHVSSGDKVVVQIKPNNIDSAYYDIVTIEKKKNSYQ